MNRPEPINQRKANQTFLLIILIVFALIFGIANAQIHRQDENRYSIQFTTDNVILQKGIIYAGVEFQAEFSNGIYIRPQIHYAALTDGYLETTAAIGWLSHLKSDIYRQLLIVSFTRCTYREPIHAK